MTSLEPLLSGWSCFLSSFCQTSDFRNFSFVFIIKELICVCKKNQTAAKEVSCIKNGKLAEKLNRFEFIEILDELSGLEYEDILSYCHI